MSYAAWERPPEYDDEPEPPKEDCLGCGRCEACIQQSESFAEEMDDGYMEPVGSCEWCGTNLYEDDDEDLCNQCAWHAAQNRGGEDCGFQPVT